MSGNRQRRLNKKLEAAQFLETHSGPVMVMLADVVSDLAEEHEGLRQFEVDLALAAELAWRLDNMVEFNDPLLEALDGVVTLFVALAAIGIWRAAARRDKLRGAKLDKLRSKLSERGPKMAVKAKRRLERRIARIEAKMSPG